MSNEELIEKAKEIEMWQSHQPLSFIIQGSLNYFPNTNSKISKLLIANSPM